MRKVRLFVIQGKDVPDFLRGELVISNLPSDATFAGMAVEGAELGIGIYSASYAPVDPEAPIPRVTPWLQRKGSRAAA